MTLAPSRSLGTRLSFVPDESRFLRYVLDERCAVPGCLNHPERGSHHIEPRSRTAGPRDFVVIDGMVVANRCRLCTMHHRQVTGIVGGHLARIVWDTVPVGHWRWQSLRQSRGNGYDLEWDDVGPLQGIEGMYDGRNL